MTPALCGSAWKKGGPQPQRSRPLTPPEPILIEPCSRPARSRGVDSPAFERQCHAVRPP